MGYTIQYGKSKHDSTPQVIRMKWKILIPVFIILCALLLNTLFSEQIHSFWTLLFPESQPEVVDAFSKLVTNMQAGESFTEAARSFCREILNAAN